MTTKQQIRAFQRKHGIYQANYTVLAFVLAVVLLLTPVLVSDYVAAKRLENQYKAQYLALE